VLNGKPLCIELFCGMFGWSAGWLELGGMAVGFDIDHQPYHGPVPEGASLVLQDVLTLDGARFKDADLILCSPPCQEFSYLAMPWSRGKQIARALRGEDDFPKGYKGSRTIKQMTALFDACFRIQREATEAAGHFIPMVIENVRGAEKWVGRAKWKWGSFYLWGDVPALMPVAGKRKMSGRNMSGDKEKRWGSHHVSPSSEEFSELMNGDGSGKSFQTASGEGIKQNRKKLNKDGCNIILPQVVNREGYAPVGHWTNPGENGTKNGGDCFSDPNWGGRVGWGKSNARKAASAQIAKIPFPLAQWITKCYWPKEQTEALEFTHADPCHRFGRLGMHDGVFVEGDRMTDKCPGKQGSRGCRSCTLNLTRRKRHERICTMRRLLRNLSCIQ